MGIFSNLFRKKTTDEESKVGGIEDFMTLIRVYYQAVMAGNLGISNINMLPDLAMFKRTLKVATQNNKLGIAEKSRCKKMLMQMFGLNEDFFKELDKDGLLVTKDWDLYDMRMSVVKTPHASQEDIKHAIRDVYRGFLQPGAIWHRLTTTRNLFDFSFYVRGVKSLFGHLFDFR